MPPRVSAPACCSDFTCDFVISLCFSGRDDFDGFLVGVADFCIVLVGAIDEPMYVISCGRAFRIYNFVQLEIGITYGDYPFMVDTFQ